MKIIAGAVAYLCGCAAFNLAAFDLPWPQFIAAQISFNVCLYIAFKAPRWAK